jgi:hypothetical protein
MSIAVLLGLLPYARRRARFRIATKISFFLLAVFGIALLSAHLAECIRHVLLQSPQRVQPKGISTTEKAPATGHVATKTVPRTHTNPQETT